MEYQHSSRSRKRSASCRTPSRPRSVIVAQNTPPVTFETQDHVHRKSRKRMKSTSNEKRRTYHRKRKRQSTEKRTSPASGISPKTSRPIGRTSRSRERRERSRHRKIKSSRRRMHEHRPSRKRSRSVRKSSSYERSNSHGRSRSRGSSRSRGPSRSRGLNRSREPSRSRGPSRSLTECSSHERSRSHDRIRKRKKNHGVRRSRSRQWSCNSRERRRQGCSKEHGYSKLNPPDQEHVSSLNVNQAFITELVKTLTSNRPEGNKFPMLGNVIPEFNPMIKGQTIHMWLGKVEECAKLYNWGDAQIIHYALPKLSGVAKAWYQALPSMSFSWKEWKLKLVESFPSIDDYAELLTEMLSKRVRYNEPLELYYYDKVNLLNRCEIYGKRAVDCMLYGIEDRSLRLGAKAAKCDEPEQVLQYFQSIKRQPHDTDRSNKIMQDKRSNSSISFNPNLNSKPHSGAGISKSLQPNNSITSASRKCYNCDELGHFSFKCPKKILKCNVCSKLGHTTINCPKLPNDSKNSTDSVTDKSVMQVDAENTNNKYVVRL